MLWRLLNPFHVDHKGKRAGESRVTSFGIFAMVGFMCICMFL